jgi:hypothetical protein
MDQHGPSRAKSSNMAVEGHFRTLDVEGRGRTEQKGNDRLVLVAGRAGPLLSICRRVEGILIRGGDSLTKWPPPN